MAKIERKIKKKLMKTLGKGPSSQDQAYPKPSQNNPP